MSPSLAAEIPAESHLGVPAWGHCPSRDAERKGRFASESTPILGGCGGSRQIWFLTSTLDVQETLDAVGVASTMRVTPPRGGATPGGDGRRPPAFLFARGHFCNANPPHKTHKSR